MAKLYFILLVLTNLAGKAQDNTLFHHLNLWQTLKFVLKKRYLVKWASVISSNQILERAILIENLMISYRATTLPNDTISVSTYFYNATLRMTIDQNYHIEVPVWVRMLAYRLAYLQKPHDILLLKRMILGLWRYGPDWDDEARKLESELKNIEPI